MRRATVVAVREVAKASAGSVGAGGSREAPALRPRPVPTILADHGGGDDHEAGALLHRALRPAEPGALLCVRTSWAWRRPQDGAVNVSTDWDKTGLAAAGTGSAAWVWVRDAILRYASAHAKIAAGCPHDLGNILPRFSSADRAPAGVRDPPLQSDARRSANSCECPNVPDCWESPLTPKWKGRRSSARPIRPTSPGGAREVMFQNGFQSRGGGESWEWVERWRGW